MTVSAWTLSKGHTRTKTYVSYRTGKVTYSDYHMEKNRLSCSRHYRHECFISVSTQSHLNSPGAGDCSISSTDLSTGHPRL